MLLQEEGREVKGYLSLYRESPDGAVGPTALTLAKESKEHAETLASISGTDGEPWHKTGAGGFLRNVVYGFNDGLTANFGLVAGVIGASVAAQHHTVIVAGVAGVIADALSMGSSGYLAAKSSGAPVSGFFPGRTMVALVGFDWSFCTSIIHRQNASHDALVVPQ